MKRAFIVMSIAVLVSSGAMGAEPLVFTIERLQRAEVPFRDKPGHSVMVLARFSWTGSTHRWVATVVEEQCQPSATYRVGLIGGNDSSFAPNLASYADKDYEWTLGGPKPVDKLFTAMCQRR